MVPQAIAILTLIAMAHLLSADAFPQSGVTERITAKQREGRREAKYKMLCSPTGEKYNALQCLLSLDRNVFNLHVGSRIMTYFSDHRSQ